MVSRLEDLAPPRVSRSARLEVVRSGADQQKGGQEASIAEALNGMTQALRAMEAELAETNGRARMIAREEAELAGARLLDEVRTAARQEAESVVDAAREAELARSPFSWTMVLVALCVSAMIGLAATLSGWAGVVAIAMAMLVWSTIAVARA